MDYSVHKIPGTLAVDPDKRGSDRDQKKGRLVRRVEEHDSISISEEARRRSASTADDQPISADHDLLEESGAVKLLT